jgi:hypothetical protein
MRRFRRLAPHAMIVPSPTAFRLAQVNGADHIAAEAPTVFKIYAVELEPLDPRTPGAAVSVPGCQGCDANSCAAGQKCSYSKFSLLCEPCPAGTVGLDGVGCELCRPGEQPSVDQARCTSCTANTFSSYGVFV